MEVKDLTERQKRIIVYFLGIGASLLVPVLFLLAPVWAFVVVKIYDVRRWSNRSLKIVLIISIILVLVTTRYVGTLSYLFNTGFTSFLIGICIVNLIKNRWTSFGMAYTISLMSSIFSSGFSINYSFYLYGTYVSSKDIIPAIIKRLGIIWYNDIVFISVIISLIIGYYVSKKTDDHIFGYAVAFLILITAVWLNLHTYPTLGSTQLSMIRGI